MAPAMASSTNCQAGNRSFSVMTFDFENSSLSQDDGEVICGCQPGGQQNASDGLKDTSPSTNSYPVMPHGDEKAVDNFSESSTPSIAATPVDTNSIMSPETVNEGRPSIESPFMNRFRILAVFLLSLANGLSDSAAGALIPLIEEQYSIGHIDVSLIFVSRALGYILASVVTDPVRQRFGRANTLCFTQLILVIGLAPLLLTRPYYLVVLSFFVIGICEAFNLAIGNVFCGSLSNGTTALGIIHGAYGIGGTVGPLIATGLLSFPNTTWRTYYCIPCLLAVINCWLSGWGFVGYEQEVGEKESADTESGKARAIVNPKTTAAALYGLLSPVTSKVLLLGSLFLFAYHGAVVSLSGWFIPPLLDTRHGDPQKVEYITSGFWVGITLGRFLLSTPAQSIGERRFVYGVGLTAATFQVVAWLVPNVIGDAIAVTFLGFLLGPIYPCALSVFMRAMDKHEQVHAMAIMAAFGSVGGAVASLTTGLLVQAVGTYVLNPIAISLYGFMLVFWYCTSDKPQNMD